MNDFVTVNITHPPVEKMLIGVGEFVRLRGKKRMGLVVLRSEKKDYLTETYTMKLAYRPSPKSTLNNKSVFSKVKIKIYNQ